MSVFGQNLVILNSFNDAHELLDHRGGTYSSRPRLVTFSEMHAASPLNPPHSGNTNGIPNLGWDGVLSSPRCTLGLVGESTEE